MRPKSTQCNACTPASGLVEVPSADSDTGQPAATSSRRTGEGSDASSVPMRVETSLLTGSIH
jgi:hypothetical protein